MEPLDLSALSFDALLSREWLCVNHLGGYAASTLTSCNTRKYHGLLVAAMTPPVRRMVILSRVEETVFFDGWPNALACNEYPDTVYPAGHRLLAAFSVEPFPRWAYQGNGWTIEKQLRLLKGQNTVVLSYTLMASAKPVELELRPLLALRGIHELMYQWNAVLNAQSLSPDRQRIPATLKTPEVFFAHDGKFAGDGYWYLNTIYRREQERGYSGLEDLWSPGAVRYTLAPGQSVHFVCSTEPVELASAVAAAERQYELAPLPAVVADDQGPDENLVALCRAAEQFVLHVPGGRTMLAGGYPWSPPNGRDAMINLPGLLLVTGRLAAARSLLEHFASMLDRGLMPSEFPMSGTSPKYGGADVSLWFIHAVREYLRYSGDEATARRLFDAVDQILTHYARGTGLGIRAEYDGLLASGIEGTPATWMDAQINEFVITPRVGRAVEINALWHSALRIGADLARQFHHPVRAEELFTTANRARATFNQRFWNPHAGCCFDVVGETDERNDGSIRPNQIFALSLPYPVLNPDRHEAVLSRISDELLTPWGLRTLARGDANYHGRYGGPVIARDRAYHQGSAYPWLLGPFVSAYIRLYGRDLATRERARRFLKPCLDHVRGGGCGQIHELFDGDTPHHPGGLTASGRSVAEVLRAYAEDVLDLAPVDSGRKVTAAQTATIVA